MPEPGASHPEAPREAAAPSGITGKAPQIWRMPAETEPQERLWMAWPSAGYVLGGAEATAETTRRSWAAVANTAIGFEPVTMVVPRSQRSIARAYLDPRVALCEGELDDAWMRDTGPSFVLGTTPDDASPPGAATVLGAVHWRFNGWGQQEWARWDQDAKVGALVGRAAGAEYLPSPLVNEGGGLHVDGQGTVLLTETVQLDPLRNPGWSKSDIEAELERTLGIRHAIWLPRGLSRDSGPLGTRGHVDLVATIPAPGELLVHVQRNPEHPDFEICAEILDLLRSSRTITGDPWRLTEVPAPAQLHDDEGWVDWSYLNHAVINHAVIACSFDDPQDEPALRILAEAYPGRRIVPLDARGIFAQGGGIHCITQQQPRSPGLPGFSGLPVPSGLR